MKPVPEMERKIWKKLPEDLRNIILQYYVLSEYDKYNKFAHDSKALCEDMLQLSCINKTMFIFLNSPHTIRTIIHRYQVSCFYWNNYDIAQFFNTRGSHKYVQKSEDLYNEFKKLTPAAISKRTPEKIAMLSDNDKFNPDKINALVLAGADINCINPNQIPILIKVINNRTKVKLALNLGANVNITYDYSRPLTYAMNAKNIPVIKLLIAHNAYCQNIPLLVSINSSSIIKLLLKQENLPSCLIYEGFYESILQKKIKLIPLFAQANPNLYKLFKSAMQLTENLKTQTRDRSKQENILEITKILCNFSNEDFRKLSEKND